MIVTRKSSGFLLKQNVEVVHGSIDLGLLLRARADELARREQQNYCFRVGHPVNETRKLLRLVH